CAIDAKTGAKHFVNEQTGVTLQGIFLASTERLYAPQGRSVPLIFAKSSGSKLGDVPGTGGVYCILTEDEQFIAIPNNQKSSENTVKLASPDSREAILNIPGANRMIAAGQYLYFHQKGKLKAIDRAVASAAQSKMTAAQKKMTALKKAKAPAKLFEPFQKAEAAARLELKAADLWSSFQPVPSALILAGDHLILGGDGVVFAVDKNTGEQIWKADLSGRVYGLAVANGRLFASTDRGHIFCFSEVTGSVR
ncbi:PQQ-binding-like beta-propeller repeat protein, partial [Verrucomicrobiales bacterium]|nr:PQQ-binding-like beta-propeller repeat protein [Verrucomicrobiales bacterium]